MEWHPEDRDAWVADAEKWIAQIKGVLQCKVDLNHEGEVSGVHVVARSDREPRHIVRDVEGLMKARLGISVFYKKIGVVQVVESDQPTEPELPRTPEPAPAEAPAEPAATLDGPAAGAASGSEAATAAAPAFARLAEPAPAEPAADDQAREAVLLAEEFAPRLTCNGVGVMTNGGQLRAEVDLQAAGVETSGIAEGSNRHGGDLHLVATATLDAIEALVDEPLGLELVDIRTERMGRDEVILVAIEMVQGRRGERLYGTCQPGASSHEAVVFAVLDALNRRLEMMLFRGTDEPQD